MRVSIQEPDATQKAASHISALLRKIDPDQKRPRILLSIGTDRLTGDSLGPLVGSRMANRLPCYGTLDEPVHAVNLAEKIREIGQKYQNPLIIAVDACLGQIGTVGTVSIEQEALIPGTGVHKNLPPAGEIAISGVVNVGGFLEYLVLQNTRLCLVMQLAECIAGALAAATAEA